MDGAARSTEVATFVRPDPAILPTASGEFQHWASEVECSHLPQILAAEATSKRWVRSSARRSNQRHPHSLPALRFTLLELHDAPPDLPVGGGHRCGEVAGGVSFPGDFGSATMSQWMPWWSFTGHLSFAPTAALPRSPPPARPNRPVGAGEGVEGGGGDGFGGAEAAAGDVAAGLADGPYGFQA